MPESNLPPPFNPENTLCHNSCGRGLYCTQKDGEMRKVFDCMEHVGELVCESRTAIETCWQAHKELFGFSGADLIKF